MADRGDTHYPVSRLNLWFAASSLLFLASVLWMVVDDWSRSWKAYQRDFKALELSRAEAALATDAALAMAQDEARLMAQLDAARADLMARQSVVDEAEGELILRDAVLFKATEAAKSAQQEYNWERFIAEEERLHSQDPQAHGDVLQEKEDAMVRLKGEQDVAAALVDEQKAVLKALGAAVEEAETEAKAAVKGIELDRKQREKLDPSDLSVQVADVIRDFPGIDFIGPRLKVNKVVLENLTFELNFTKKPRIDMCSTCHLSIDREGYVDEDIHQPLRSHPRLDLFLSSKSPHPMSSTGCTICHRGSGEALDFIRADHRPSDTEESDEWYDEYHWHKQHHWDYPMLSEDYIEAGCVQCHTDSMEIIADEAPKMTAGYRMFERYGCYACHKVDWFPTKRRPGPSLKAIAEKTSKDFVASWVAEPRSFRPTTWMPQVFHLENYAADEAVVAKAEWGKGGPILGQAWNDTAIAAVTEYVWSLSSDAEYPAIPVEGDALRGSEVFRLSGCLACHNMAGFDVPEGEESFDPAQQKRGTNENGPNLRGIATKTSPEWLYAWIKDPTAYWSETRMPNLRLSDQDAADIVAYLFEDPDGIFLDVPEGWAEVPATHDRAALEEQARWFFTRESRVGLEDKFADEAVWKDDAELLKAVGEKFVLNQGCHSCHEIQGLEDAMPIGTELTKWGSKTVDKLDWGLIPEIWAEEKVAAGMSHNDAHHWKEELKRYREPWIEQKVQAPRSFDRRKVKNPSEKLRMPLFGFSEEEARTVSSFVVGLVEDEVARARMVPSAEEASLDLGLRAIRQRNCQACHVIEPGTIEWTDGDGAHHRVRGEFFPFLDEVLPPSVAGFRDAAGAYVEWMKEDDGAFELEEVTVQLLEDAPGLGVRGGTYTIEGTEAVASIRTSAAWGGDLVEVIMAHYLDPWGYNPETDEDISLTGDPEGSGRVQDVDGQWRAYDEEEYAPIRWAFAPPVLIGEGDKLQRNWFHEFLLDPEPLRRQIRVRMPTFSWANGEAGAVADAFAYMALRDWPRRYARALLLETDMTPEAVAAEMDGMKAAKTLNKTLKAEQIQAIVDGAAPETRAGLATLMAWGAARGFTMTGPVSTAYESIPQRSATSYAEVLEQNPEFHAELSALANQGPDCFSCHYLNGQEPGLISTPLSYAPDLYRVQARLRPDWVRDWMSDPARFYPGTKMPANFPADQTQYQDLYPGTSAEQIEAILTWLYNMDRAPIPAPVESSE